MKNFFAIIILMCFISGAFTSLCAEENEALKLQCPLCKTKFSFTFRKNFVFTDNYLDMKPVCDTPVPWIIPECPKCKMVIYKEKIPRDELNALRDFVSGKDYQSILNRSANYRMAKFYEILKRDYRDIAMAYLKASWDEEADKEKYLEDIGLAVKNIDLFMETGDVQHKDWENLGLLKGELLRRSSEFKKAVIHFDDMRKFVAPRGNLERITGYELKLIKDNDSAPHKFSEIDEKK